jgi:WD40 repeat protein/predicted Ser/Thr protein kinase
MPEPSPESVEALFQEVIDLDPEQRCAFLDERCAGAPDLRAAVEELLLFDDKAQATTGFLRSPVAEVRRLEAPTTPGDVPASIGRYRVVRRLGEGGMGTVYEAEQDEPRRTVALKVMRPGLDSRDNRKRFAQEARILGKLHHPGIAQVYDAGATEDGRLYFAMEFIRGSPLLVHVRGHDLTTAARLELLARVCDAVQHAHEQGIIHRDLKPANILVEDTGQPKVLDFGIAHAASSGPLGSTVHTRTGQMIGTLGYMSPEQVTGDPRAVDGRSDVYALGVILFELMAQRLPFELNDLPIPEAIRMIQEEEPSRLGSVNRQFRGDIETIVAKTLEKDRARRYASAGELAADLRRHLAHEPILAQPPSALYQMRKFVRRHTALVTGTLAVMATLVLGLIGTILFAVDARRNATIANDREQEARSQTYRARLAAAAGALGSNDVVDAAKQLAEAPEELRGWEWHHLHSRLDDSSLVIPMAHEEAIRLADTRDGLLVVGVSQSRVRLLNMNGHELLSRSYPNPETWPCADLLPSPGRDFVQLDGNAIQLVDQQGRVRKRLPGLSGRELGNVRMSTDGTRVLVSWIAKGECTLALYDTSRALPLPTYIRSKDYIWCLAMTPDGTRFAVGYEDGTARLWDGATGKLTAECHGHRLKVLNVAFRPDGKRLVTASADGSVRQWDAETGQEVAPPYERHAGEVTTAAYSPDGAYIASGSTDRTVRLWRATDRQEVAVFHGHKGFVAEVAFSASGRHLLSVGAYFGALGLGKSAAQDSTVRLWEVEPEAGLPVLRGHTSYVYPVAYSPDGQWIASGSWDDTVRLWDGVTGELAATFRYESKVRNLAFGPDSSWLISTSDTGDRLRICDVVTGRLRTVFKGLDADVLAVAVNWDGTRVATSTVDKVRIMETATGREVASWTGCAREWEEKRALAFSPDGRLLAGTSEDLTVIEVWDTQLSQPTARLVGHTAVIYAVAFSSDGRWLASTGHDRSVRVWDVATGQCLQVLNGHTDQVFALAFHPDPHAMRLASGGRDRAVWLWDLAKGQEVARLQGHTNYIFSLAFSPDGKSLVSGSGDSTVRLWDTEPLQKRYQARREAQALRPEAERLVERLFQEKKNADDVVMAIRADQSLNEVQRHAAFRAVLRRSH